MSRFHNISSAELADRLGRTHFAIKELEAQATELKAELIGRGVSAVRGDDFAVTISESTSKTLDTAKVKDLLGDELPAYQKESTSTRVNIKPVVKMAEVA